MTTITACPLCGQSAFTTVANNKDFTASQKIFHIQACNACSFVLTNPRPKSSELARYYESDEYISHKPDAKGIINTVYRIARRYALQHKTAFITKVNNGTGKLLDYGCGSGGFVDVANNSGWQVTGYEPSAGARQAAINLNPAVNISSSTQAIKGTFDIITLWHVLEHVEDLHEKIEWFKSLLTENGSLIIAVPNHNAWERKIYQDNWAAYDAPRHLWHFTQNTMASLMNQHGLTIKRTFPMKLDAYYISMLSIKNSTGKLGLMGMLKATLAGLRSNLSAINTGEYSSLIYVIKK